MSTIAYQRTYYGDVDGKPLDAGKVYIGVENMDPQTNPVACYWNAALTVPANQPLSVTAGYITNNGLRAPVYTAPGSYSVRVSNKAGTQIDYVPSIQDGALTAALAGSGGAALVGFIQAGTGAVARTAQAKMREIVTPYDFGAVGDGTTDDTAAVQAAFNTTATRVSLPYGSFNISSTVTSAVANRVIDGPGTITATGALAIALIVSGNNSNVRVNIAGNNKIGVGVRVENASKVIVEQCRITDLYSTTANCAGVFLSETLAGAIVRNNTIINVNSVGNGSLGDTSGYSRGVVIGYSAAATGETVIEGNYIENVIGEEGDAIAGNAGGSGTYYRLDLTVRGNTIRGFTRRAVKTQGNNVRVLANYITHDWTSAAQVPNAASVIDFVQGGDCIASLNTLYACNFFNQISVVSVGTEVWNNFTITGNLILGLTSANTPTVISITQSGPTSATSATGLIVRGNTLTGGLGRSISIGKCTNPIIADNIISCSDESSTRTISFVSTVVGAMVSGNVMIAGARQSFIANDGTNGVHVNNHVKCNTPLFSNSGGSGNHLINGNSIDGTAADYYDANSLISNRWGGTFNFGAQTTANPGDLSTSTAAGPTVSLAGLQVRLGQRVYDSTPTAAGKIGWTATTSGEASAVTWKQFGAIDA